MTDFIDYDLITRDMAAAIKANVTGVKEVFADANDWDFVVANMPMADVRVRRTIPSDEGGRNYWTDVVMEVELGAFDMTNRRDAAKIRNDLANAVQRYFQDNPRFSGAVDTTLVGNGEFATTESTDQGAFVAVAILQFNVKVYTNG